MLHIHLQQQQSFYDRFPCLHRGWPTALQSSLLHLSLSFPFSLFNPHSLMSLSTTWLHVILSLSRPLLPSTSNDMIFFTQSSSSFRSTCPNHLNLFRFTASDTDSIPILSLSSALGTLSLSDTPHIHLTILISVRSNLPLCSAVMAHVSLPYTIALLTHVTYSFPFSLSDTSFLVKIPDNSLNFLHAQRSLAKDAEYYPGSLPN